MPNELLQRQVLQEPMNYASENRRDTDLSHASIFPPARAYADAIPDVHSAIANSFVLVLAGGRGSRMAGLTAHRTKPSVYFGGKYRIIDFALSNCVNSGFRRIGILTQYKSHSLLAHIRRGWNFLKSEVNEFVELIPAQQQLDEEGWYKGTADAVRQNIGLLLERRPKYIVILAGDHIYKMDYKLLLESHIATRADVTVACVEVPRAKAAQFGIVQVGAYGQIANFIEKPVDPPGLPTDPDASLASMGIYVFNAQTLFDELARDATDAASTHDFGRDIIPGMVPRASVGVHRFESSCVSSRLGGQPYWRDVGTLDSFWQANIDLTHVEPALNLYDQSWPIFTYHEQLPPAKFVHDVEGRRGVAINSIVADGCIVSGSTVRRSVLSSSIRVNSYACLEGAVLLPHVVVGRGARLSNVVVDRGCEVPAGLVVGENAGEDASRFFRTAGGVTLVTRDALARLDGSVP